MGFCLVALAALAVSGAAMAQVTLSGRTSIDMGTWQAVNSTAGSGSDLASRTRVADSGSRITFSVNENLGGGMKAGLICETGINVDNGERTGQSGGINSNTQNWCSREGRAYFGNNLVEARLGRQNVFWTSGAPDQTGSNLGGSSVSANLYTGGVGLYTVRGENMIKLVAGSEAGAFAGSELYTGFMQSNTNPTSMGTSATADYSWATQTGESAGAGVSGGGYNGFKLTYNSGPLNLMVDYQSYTKSAPTFAVTAAGVSTQSRSSFSGNATKYQLGYALGGESMVSVQYWAKSRTDETLSTNAYAAATGNGSDSGWVVNYNHDFKNSFVGYAQYGKANNITGGPNGTEQAGTDATAYMVGALKRFSKRTHIYASYFSIANGAAAAYNMTGGTYNSGTAPAGSTVTMTALGMIHMF